MKLDNIKKLTIEDVVDFAPIMGLSIKNAKPEIAKFKEKHGLSDAAIKEVGGVVFALGLYG